MNILSETKELIEALGISVETGVFKGTAPDSYVVLVPLSDSFPLNADDRPLTDEQELRITIYSKSSYMQMKTAITSRLLECYFTITDRRYNGYETDTGYYQYTIDVAKIYELEETN